MKVKLDDENGGYHLDVGASRKELYGVVVAVVALASQACKFLS